MRLDHVDEGYRCALSRLRQLAAVRIESGQAMVEFALILVPLLIIVVGIIQFGIGLNYWLDMNRLANQGARWAVVELRPVGATAPLAFNPCSPSLEQALSSSRR